MSDPGEYMCPNCVTPWKCNGPHIPGPTFVDEPAILLLDNEEAVPTMLAIVRRLGARHEKHRLYAGPGLAEDIIASLREHGDASIEHTGRAAR